MKIYALSDPHLSISIPNKTMEVFGKKWSNYIYKLEKNWNNIVTDNDIVILPGDISWCTRLSEAYEDFNFLNSLNGIKLISKGNHDYWFSTKKKVSDYFRYNFNKLYLIEKDYYFIDNTIVIGFKGFNPQIDKLAYKMQQTKQYNRLELLLNEILSKYINNTIILSYHFPPIFNNDMKFHELFKKYNINYCLYGHIHEEFNKVNIPIGNIDNINYHFVTSDYLDFTPKLILDYEVISS